MEKKIFNAPYLKVVSVSNDIIATSGGLGDDATLGNHQGFGTTGGFAPRRGANIWSDGESVEDMDF